MSYAQLSLSIKLFGRCQEMNPPLLRFEVSLASEARITSGKNSKLHEIEVS